MKLDKTRAKSHYHNLNSSFSKKIGTLAEEN